MPQRGIRVQLDTHHTKLLQHSASQTLAAAAQRSSLHTLDVVEIPISSRDFSPEVSHFTSIFKWFRRPAHVSSSAIRPLPHQAAATGSKIVKADSLQEFVCCITGRYHRTPISKVTQSTSIILRQVVHTDVLGPVEVFSLGGARYFLFLAYCFIKSTVVRTVTQKSRTLIRFKDYKALAEKTHPTPFKLLMCKSTAA